MKKAKQFLQNIMLIEESKGKIKKILEQYLPEINDEKVSTTHLESIISELKIIIDLNKKNNTPNQDDIDCLRTLEEKLILRVIKS